MAPEADARTSPRSRRGNYQPLRVESLATRWKRRVLSIGRTYLLLSLLTVLLPLLLPLAVLTDLLRALMFRTPMTVVRLVLFMWLFLWTEALSIPVLGGVWLLTLNDPEARVEQTFTVQKWWNQALFRIVQTLFGLTVSLEGQASLHPGPTLIFIRHSSIVDVLLPVVFVAAREDILLRFVLKRELLNDPCLDIAGQRLPNYFVSRGTGETRELEGIQQLAQGMGPGEALLIYPEGTRFSPKKRLEALEKLAAMDAPLLEQARQLRHVLPPRLGGPLALLEQGLDVVIMAHVGLERLAHFNDLWRGGLVKRSLHLKFWRVSAEQIPSSREERARWLYEQWRQIDEWIDTHRRV